MLKRILILFVLSVSVLLTFAQSQKLIAKLVQDKKNTGAQFAAFSPLTEDEAPGLLKTQASRTVSKSSILNIDNARIKQLLEARPEAMRMPVSSAISGDIELELVKVNLYASDFSVVTDKNEKFKAVEKEVHYRGIVKGNDNALVALSIFDNKLMGVISLPDEGNLVLAELEGSNPGHKHVIYKDRDLKIKSTFNCGTDDQPEVKYSHELLFNDPASAARGQGASCVRIYVEADFNIFQNRGSVANVNTFITGLFNQSAMLYQNEGIPMVLSQIFVWTSASPYVTSSSSAYLASFQSFRNTFNGDLGHLVGFYNFGGIAAGFTGLCNTNRDFDQCVSGLQVPPYPTVPAYSWNVMVFTHEMGHLLGSRHTHACVWNGNNTAIDGCSGFTEGGCPLPPAPAGGGTIMSYCHINAVGINFTRGFGPQPSNVIRNRVFAAACLNACNPQPAVDLYIKDRPADNGTEPNPDNVMWASEDIWVRNANDGGTIHQNPIGNTGNFIYVRVRNRGTAVSLSMSNIRLRAYWAKASAALSWPSPWNNTATGCIPPVTMGNTVGAIQIPAIPANGSTVLVFPWNAPLPANYACFGADRFHFCLLGRIETTDYAPFGMTFPEVTGQLYNNVRNNNNIAWKNVSVSNPNGGFSRLANTNRAADDPEGNAMFIVAGEKTTGIKADIVRMEFNFEKNRQIAGDATLKPKTGQVIVLEKEPINIFPVALPQAPIAAVDANEFDDVSPTPYKTINKSYNVWDFAEVWADIGALYDNWDKTGVYVEELPDKAPSGRPWLKLLKPGAVITGLEVAPDLVQAVTVKIAQVTAAGAGDETQFDFDVVVKDATGRLTIGAENFLTTLGTVQVAPLKSANARAGASQQQEAPGEVNSADMMVNNAGKNVYITTSLKDVFEANIFDQAGKLVERKKFTGKTVVGGNNLAKGIYLVSIINVRTKEMHKRRIFVE
jgi:Metallo-peptidase family M12